MFAWLEIDGSLKALLDKKGFHETRIVLLCYTRQYNMRINTFTLYSITD